MILIIMAVTMFLIAIVPGGIIAYFLDKLPVGWNWLVFLSAGLAALAAFLVSILVSLRYRAAPGDHAFNVMLMAPFVFLTTLLQLYWLRKEPRSPS